MLHHSCFNGFSHAQPGRKRLGGPSGGDWPTGPHGPWSSIFQASEMLACSYIFGPVVQSHDWV